MTMRSGKMRDRIIGRTSGWPRHRINAMDAMIAKLCAWTAQTAQTVSLRHTLLRGVKSVWSRSPRGVLVLALHECMGVGLCLKEYDSSPKLTPGTRPAVSSVGLAMA